MSKSISSHHTPRLVWRVLLAVALAVASASGAAAQDVLLTPSVFVGDVEGAPFVGDLEVLVTVPAMPSVALGIAFEGSFLGGVPVQTGYAAFLTPLVLVTRGLVYGAAGPSLVVYEEPDGTATAAGGSVELGVAVPVGEALALVAVRGQEYATDTDAILGRVFLRLGVSVPIK